MNYKKHETLTKELIKKIRKQLRGTRYKLVSLELDEDSEYFK